MILLVAGWVTVALLAKFYRERKNVRRWVRLRWEALEAALCEKMSAAMAKELGMDVVVEKLRLRTTGIQLLRVRMGEATPDSPYNALIDELDFRTSGYLGLMSVGGVAWFGGPRHDFYVGFAVRNVEAIVLSGVYVECEDDKWRTEGLDAQGPKRRTVAATKRPGFVAAMVMTKKKMTAKKKERLKARHDRSRAFAQAFVDEWQPEDPDAVFDSVLAPHPDASWRIGVLEILDMTVSVWGYVLHLDSWQSKGLVGSTAWLQTYVGMEVLNEMMGPRYVVKQAVTHVYTNFKQARKDVTTLARSAIHDAKNGPGIRRRVHNTFFKKYDPHRYRKPDLAIVEDIDDEEKKEEGRDAGTMEYKMESS